MTKTDKPKYQPTRWTTCCQCHGALDTLSGYTASITGGVKRYFHHQCFIRLEKEHGNVLRVQ